MAQKVHRVRAADLEVGAQIERSEHPWMNKQTSRRTAREHLQKDPNAYNKEQGDGGRVIVILNQNVKAIPPHKRKKAMPMQQLPDDKPTWVPEGLRRPF